MIIITNKVSKTLQSINDPCLAVDELRHRNESNMSNALRSVSQGSILTSFYVIYFSLNIL